MIAFGSDELLIGLAGIDVFIDNLGEPLRSSVFIEVTRRIDESLLKPLYISSVPCYYQVIEHCYNENSIDKS